MEEEEEEGDGEERGEEPELFAFGCGGYFGGRGRGGGLDWRGGIGLGWVGRDGLILGWIGCDGSVLGWVGRGGAIGGGGLADGEVAPVVEAEVLDEGV